ncbi:unnamed protein product [Effrenium voratum]|uniref:Uncharacterized protein n=1 Tax=Effrenium voratum TaxID=2562239 RepID=A0AA36HLY5_9DINO|nr:unnamed protein product [Effrenium voratum]CAJ1371600.1 unnamed protein product [Effrenium voratum]CAJ1460734.1 unnamed protein product [Effrenium voratum]
MSYVQSQVPYSIIATSPAMAGDHGPESALAMDKKGLLVEDEMQDIEKEAHVRNLPRLVGELPSDRAARRRGLESRLRIAHAKVAAITERPLIHGRCAILGLLVLASIRAAAAMQGNIPGYSVYAMHFLTTSSDVICVVCSLPLFAFGARGLCVQKGCLGPMLTLVFAMSLVDISAFGAYLLVATPRPLAPGSRSVVDVMEAMVGVWEWALLASVALQTALCASSWRIYRALRMAGLYAPEKPSDVARDRQKEISVLEIVCEAEDIDSLEQMEFPCCEAKSDLSEVIIDTRASIESAKSHNGTNG